nr:hypothetical protein [Tanacetum cinerariifolium]
MNLIPKRKNEIMVVKTTKTICLMMIKNVKIDGMTHDRSWRSIHDIIMKRIIWLGEGVSFEEGGKDYGFDSNEDEVVPKVDDVSLVDGVLMVHLVEMEMRILL